MNEIFQGHLPRMDILWADGPSQEKQTKQEISSHSYLVVKLDCNETLDQFCVSSAQSINSFQTVPRRSIESCL